MTISVWAVAKTKEQLGIFPPQHRKAAKPVLGAKIPTIFLGHRLGSSFSEDTTAAVAFHHRRVSHNYELKYWWGTDQKILAETLKACMLQATIEGRWRGEVFNETQNTEFRQALQTVGWDEEGHHQLWTKTFDDVDVFSWIAWEKKKPRLLADTIVTLGTNDQIAIYREKSIQMYRGDRDLWNYDNVKYPFSQVLEEMYDEVKSDQQVLIWKWPESFI